MPRSRARPRWSPPKRSTPRALRWRGLGADSEAVREVERSVEVAEAAGLPGAACRGYTNLGVLYTTINPARAIEVCRRGLEVARRIGDLGFQARLLANLAVACCTFTDRCSDEGVPAAEKAIEIDRALDQREHLSVPLIVLGQIHQCNGKPELAVGLYNEALEVARETDEPQLLFPCYDGLATLNLDLDNLAEADRYFALAQDVCAQHGLDPEALSCCRFSTSRGGGWTCPRISRWTACSRATGRRTSCSTRSPARARSPSTISAAKSRCWSACFEACIARSAGATSPRWRSSTPALREKGVESLTVVNTPIERARLYFRYHPMPALLGGVGPGTRLAPRLRPAQMRVHRERDAPGRTRSPMSDAMAMRVDMPGELPEPMNPFAAVEFLDKKDDYEITEADQQMMATGQGQLVGQFLLDRDGVVRWSFTEVAEGGRTCSARRTRTN